MQSTLVATAVSSALALPLAAQAVEFSVSGQVNRVIISVDGQDNDGDVQHVDANSSRTRFYFTGSEELDSGLTAGVQLEWAALNGADGGPTILHGNAYLSSTGDKLTLGQGSTAADGMTHADLGGASFLGGVTNWCSYHSTGPDCPSNNGGRGPMLRYDTPAIGAATIAVLAAEGNYWDAKISVVGSMGDTGSKLPIGHIQHGPWPCCCPWPWWLPCRKCCSKLDESSDAGPDGSIPLMQDPNPAVITTAGDLDDLLDSSDVDLGALIRLLRDLDSAVTFEDDDKPDGPPTSNFMIEEAQSNFLGMSIYSFESGSIKAFDYGDIDAHLLNMGVDATKTKDNEWGTDIGYGLGGSATSTGRYWEQAWDREYEASGLSIYQLQMGGG